LANKYLSKFLKEYTDCDEIVVLRLELLEGVEEGEEVSPSFRNSFVTYSRQKRMWSRVNNVPLYF